MGFLDRVYDLLGMATILPTTDRQHNPTVEGQDTLTTEEGGASDPTTGEIKPIRYKYSPKSLSEYVGQENAKEVIRLNLQKIMNGNFVNILISGFSGGGKTAMAQVIANHLDFDFNCYIGGSFSYDNLFSFLRKNKQSNKPQILFIDEIHGIDVKVAEFLYPIISEYTMPATNQEIKPFVVIFATTNKDILIKKLKPLVNRCECAIVLEEYSYDEIKTIIKQYVSHVYKVEIPEEVYDLLARNCRFCPRVGLSLLSDYMICRDIKKVLRINRIIKDSLTDIDIRILKYLNDIGKDKPIGEGILSTILGYTRNAYHLEIEEFLIKQQYVSVVRGGRILTNKGRTFLEKL